MGRNPYQVKCLFIILLILFSMPALAQEATRQEILDFSAGYTRSFWAAKAEAVRVATENNWPVRKEYPDGRIIEIMYLDDNGMPEYVMTDNRNAAITSGTDNLWSGGDMGLSLTGDIMLIGEWDGGGVRTTHQEFRVGAGASRVTQRDAPPGFSNHSTHVAGTLIAEGQVVNAHGMATEADLDAYDWDNDVGEMGLAYTNDDLRLSNHSYGAVRGWYDDSGTWFWYGDITISTTEDYRFGFYGPLAKTWDSLARLCPEYLIMKSAGNDRNDDWNGGHWVWSGGAWTWSTASRDPDGGTDGYDCIGNRGVAKNVLTVGAVEEITGGYSQPSDVIMTDFSGWGPTDDGRIKPDIVADGADLYSSIATGDDDYGNFGGTSQSTPTVTGSLALLQEYHHDLNGNYMYADELKALVINTADEAGPADGPDYKFGWGLLNTDGAAALIRKDDSIGSLIRRSYLSNGETETYTYYSDGNHPFKVTICWIDPAHSALTPALNPTTACLVNDLDLRVIGPTGLTTYPWRLNPASPGNNATRADNFRDNVETAYLATPYPGEHTIQVTHKGTISGQYYGLVVSGLQTQRFTNTWTGGGASDYWYVDANWSLDHDPVISENALIPDGSNFHAIVDIVDGRCRTLEVGDDALLEIHDDTLTIDGNFYLYGELEMDMDPGRLIINGSVYNYNNSTLDIQAPNCMIWVEGNWRFYSGTNAVMTNGIVNLTGTGNSYIYSYDDNACFNKLGIYKTAGGLVEHASASTYPLRINDYFYLHFDSEFRSNTSQPVIIQGYFSKASSATCNLNMGEIVMDGTANTINFDGSGYFHDLTISPASTTTLLDDIAVHGDLLIEQGTLVPGNHKIHMWGNWANSVGDAGFTESGSRVMFDYGDGSSSINSSENFDTLDIAIFDAVYIDNDADSVTCDHLYVTGGAMNVSAGSFTADDLVQGGIYGGWFVSGTGTVNLYQDAGQLIDLYGFLNISGGAMNIYGSWDDSYWAYSANNSVTISGGVLDFVNQGVEIFNSYSMTENITGGTIRVAKDFRVHRGDFNPTGGVIEFTSTNDAITDHDAGSNFYSVTVNKFSTEADEINPNPFHLNRDTETDTETDASSGFRFRIFRKKPGSTRSTTLVLTSDLDLNGNLVIDEGILDVSANNYSINIAGDWTNNVGLAGFNERSGTVTFDGSAGRDITTNESFYDLVLNKTYTGIAGLEILFGRQVQVANNLTLTDGTMEMNTSSVLEITGDLEIATGAGINADDNATTVRIEGDWTDNNATISSTAGFSPGYYSTVLFHGTSVQHLYSTASTVLFDNITIDKETANFRPHDNLELRGDLNIISGWWWDAVASLTHSFRGHFTVQSTGGYSTNTSTITRFIGSSDQVISWEGSNGYFSDLIIDKSIADDGGRANTVSLATPILLLNDKNLYVNYGTLDLNGQYVRVTGDVKIYSGGSMDIDNDAWLEVGGSDSLIVYSGGTLEVIGEFGHEAGVKGHNGDNYAFNIESGGNISARYGIFQNMNANGINCKSGSLVNETNDFDFCTFKNGYDGTGTLLNINNNQVLNIDSAFFPVESTTTTKNVTKTMNQGQVTFTGAVGSFAGPLYEDDPFDRINWTENGIWEGTVSNNWSTAGNWGFDLVPTSTVDVVIPAGCPNYPVLTNTLGVGVGAYSYSCRSLSIETGGALTISSDHSLYNYGEVIVNGRLEIGNDLRCYNASALYMESDTIWLGTVNADGRLYMFSGSEGYQTGGHLYAESYYLYDGCQYNGYNGTTHLYANGSHPANAIINISDPDSFFRDFYVDTLASGYMSTSLYDLQCSTNFKIYGSFNPYGKNVNTSYMDVYGTLTIDSGMIAVAMNGPYFHYPAILNMTGGTIDAGNWIRWYSGTEGIVTGGDIYVKEIWRYYGGIDVQVSEGSIMHFEEAGGSSIYCEDDNSTFGTIEFDKPPDPSSDIYLFSSEPTPMHVTGNLNLHDGNQCHFSGPLIIDGEFVNETGSEIDMSTGASLVTDGDFTLRGLMNIDEGDALIHGVFDHVSSGDMVINNGSFICDHAYTTARTVYYINGDFSMTSGTFEISHNHLAIGPSAIIDISGGIIRVGGSFISVSGNFAPAGGTLQLINYSGAGIPYVDVTGGSFLYNLTVDGNVTWLLGGGGPTELYIVNDLTINSGGLNGSDDIIYLGDDWINNVGNAGFVHGTGAVNLNGSTPTPEVQQIDGATTFYDLVNQNTDCVIEVNGPITVTNNYEASNGGSDGETLIVGSPVEISNLILPQGYFSLSSSAPTVNVGLLDQGGSIQLTDGTLNVGDILEAGLYGVYTLYDGVINITQVGGAYVDLYGDLYIYNGEFNIIGGSDRSYWPYSGTHVIEISGGTLDFQDIGIYLINNDVTYNITGGKIRTSGDFISYPGVSVFDPSAGDVELYGNSDRNVGLGTGSYFHNLLINKTGSTIWADKDFPVKNEMRIENGTFSTNGFEVIVGP